jgi:hypothetical protein
MRIIWDDDKNQWLKTQRNISFEVICEKINNRDILDVFANPSPKYPNQGVFVLKLFDYTWFVPFSDDGNTIKLIPAYPSRKAHKIYRGEIK